MFDPTAFENMRVVLEGLFYDKDLSGEIIIQDRNDMINTAKLSRTYNISFQLPASSAKQVVCKLSLKANIENLAAELLPSFVTKNFAGCIVKIEFSFMQRYDQAISAEVERLLREIWGEKRTIRQTVCLEKPFHQALYTAFISFDRIVSEEQIDDLSEMTEFIMTTLEQLEKIVTD